MTQETRWVLEVILGTFENELEQENNEDHIDLLESLFSAAMEDIGTNTEDEELYEFTEKLSEHYEWCVDLLKSELAYLQDEEER